MAIGLVPKGGAGTKLGYFVGGLAVLVLQRELWFFSLGADIMIPVICQASFSLPLGVACTLAFLWGCTSDLYASGPIGITAMSYLVIAVLAYEVAMRLTLNLLLKALLVFFLGFAHQFVIFGIKVIFTDYYGVPGTSLSQFLIGSLLSGFLGLPIFYLGDAFLQSRVHGMRES